MRVARSARHRHGAATRPALVLLVLLAWAPAFCSTSPEPAQFPGIGFISSPEPTLAGTYEGHARATDAAKRSFTLRLSPDGAALLTTVYIGKHLAAEPGRWSQNGKDLVLTFDPLGSSQPPRPITFHYHRQALHPIHWDASEWGRDGPPVLYRNPRGAMTPPGSS